MPNSGDDRAGKDSKNRGSKELVESETEGTHYEASVRAFYGGNEFYYLFMKLLRICAW